MTESRMNPSPDSFEVSKCNPYGRDLTTHEYTVYDDYGFQYKIIEHIGWDGCVKEIERIKVK